MVNGKKYVVGGLINNMTKKHFIALADMLTEKNIRRHCNVTESGDGTYVHVGDLRSLLASYCSDMNHRFDRHRWLSYINGECGPNGGQLKK